MVVDVCQVVQSQLSPKPAIRIASAEWPQITLVRQWLVRWRQSALAREAVIAWIARCDRENRLHRISECLCLHPSGVPSGIAGAGRSP